MRQTADGLRLVQKPVRELIRLRDKHHRLKNATFAGANTWLARLKPASDLLEIDVEFESAPTAGELGLRIITGTNEATVIRYQAAQGRLSLDRTQSGRVDFHPKFTGVHEAPVRLADGRLRLHLFLDTSSLELFADIGVVSLTSLILPKGTHRGLQLESTTGDVVVKHLDIWQLKRAVH